MGQKMEVLESAVVVVVVVVVVVMECDEYDDDGDAEILYDMPCCS